MEHEQKWYFERSRGNRRNECKWSKFLLAANAVSFGVIFGGIGLYIKILNYNNGEFYTDNNEFDYLYAFKILLVYSAITTFIMLILGILIYIIYIIFYINTIVNKIILAWIISFIVCPILYFGLTLDFVRLLDLPKYGLANAIAEVVNGVSPIALKVLLAELVLYTAAWLVVAGVDHWNGRNDRSRQVG